jgi:hypothetical protein
VLSNITSNHHNINDGMPTTYNKIISTNVGNPVVTTIPSSRYMPTTHTVTTNTVINQPMLSRPVVHSPTYLAPPVASPTYLAPPVASPTYLPAPVH